VSPVDEEDRGEANMDMDMDEGEAAAEEAEGEEEEEGKDDAVHVFSGHHGKEGGQLGNAEGSSRYTLRRRQVFRLLERSKVLRNAR
jgi:hypothetical protein